MDIDIRILIDKIIKDDKIMPILKELSMHHIKENEKYFSCGMPDGDNISSTLIYKNNLSVVAYTRDIADKFNNSDIISLVMFIKNIYFLNAIKWISDICGYDYYNIDTERPNVLKVMDSLRGLKSNKKPTEDEVKLKPLDNDYLKTYLEIPSYKFYKDGINIDTQYIYNIHFDLQSHRIVIPIYDEIGTLVGIKGRLNYEDEDTDEDESKYLYLTSMPKSQILFGLDKTYEYIKELGIVYVAESEKAVMQGWSKGIRNIVSIGGHQLSKIQVKKLTHLGVEICLAYDDKANFEKKNEIYVEIKDFYKKEKSKFLDSVEVNHIIDDKNLILKNKESPFDRLEHWEDLQKMKRYIL
jgi:DNA primase